MPKSSKPPKPLEGVKLYEEAIKISKGAIFCNNCGGPLTISDGMKWLEAKRRIEPLCTMCKSLYFWRLPAILMSNRIYWNSVAKLYPTTWERISKFISEEFEELWLARKELKGEERVEPPPPPEPEEDPKLEGEMLQLYEKINHLPNDEKKIHLFRLDKRERKAYARVRERLQNASKTHEDAPGTTISQGKG